MYSPTHKYVYLMGLIDYLGKWNIQKKSELLGKTFLAHFIRQNTDFSVKPPHEFANRFLKKVKRIFKVHAKEDACERNRKKMHAFNNANNDIFNNDEEEEDGASDHE